VPDLVPVERSPERELPRAEVPPAEAPGVRALFGVVVGVVVVAALYLGRDVLVPIMLAVLLSFILAPLVDLLRRGRLPRGFAVTVAILVALGVIGSLGAVIGTQVASLAADAPRYAATVEEKLDTLRGSTVGRLPQILGRLGKQLEGDAAPARTPATPGGPVETPAVPVEVREPTPSPLALVGTILAPVVGPLETTLIVLVVTVFGLMQREDLRDRFIRLFGATDLHRTTTAMDDAARRLSRYFVTQLALNAAFGLIITLGLSLIGVPSPALWGILAGLLRFVPYIGSVLAAVPPVLLAAAVDPGWSMAIWTAVLFLIAEPGMGYGIEPTVYGHSTGLSPVMVIVAAIFWTWLWGPIGLILSTPLTLCLVVLGRHVERLEFLDVLFGDRPALTPPESFYQRMLAGDPDEVLDQAEALLKERPLSTYYDEVALKGLQLAAADAARGVLTRERLAEIASGVRDLVADLDDHLDKATERDADDPLPPTLDEQAVPDRAAPADPSTSLPAAWRVDGAVLCVAGRGPLDDGVAAMLAQLLRKHGFGARTLPFSAVSRAQIAMLDAPNARMICVSYLELSGAPSHLRYLLRRLRQRFPSQPMLLGLWPARATAGSADIEADYHVASLHDAVDACVDAAARDAASDPAEQLQQQERHES
jgi:predicted PurR-regulated permease PerM